MFKFVAIICLLTIYKVNGQAPVLPSYYSRPNYYPTSLYNPQSTSYPQSSTSLNAALAYQQEQNLERQQALAAYQQQANLAGLPQSRPSYTSSPSVNYSPQQLPAVNYQQQPVAPQTSYEQPSSQYQPQTSYNPQGLQTISYQPQAEQPVAPGVTSYDPQPQPRQPAYSPQPAYNPEEIAALQRQRESELAIQRQRENELALQRQREAQLAALQRQREVEINIRRQKEAEIALQRERDSAIAAQAQRDAIAAQQAAQRQAAQQAAAQQAAAQQAAAQQAAAQQARYQPQSQPASSAFGYQPSRQVAPATTEAPKVVHRPAEIFYSKIGEKLDGDYTFGYHTGKGENDNSFREEKRLPDGTVSGAYGYVDKDGKKHVVKYTAGSFGFRVEGDVNPDIAAASQNAHKLPALESTTETPYRPSPQPAAQPSYRPSPQPAAQLSYRPSPQPAAQPSYQPPVAPTTSAPISLASYNSQPAVNAGPIPSEYERARQQVAANRYSQNERPVASAYQAPISPSYQRQNLGQNLSYRPPTRAASAAPIGTHLATSASSYPTTARINSRAVRKLLQTRHRQQPSSTIDTSASVLSSSVSQPVKLKASSSVQILTQPVPPVPNYEPINPASVRMQRARVATAYTGNIETSASSAKLSYSAEPIKKAATAVEQPIVVKPQIEKVIESRSEDKLESRSDSADNLESRIDSPINFPTIALNSFLSKIK